MANKTENKFQASLIKKLYKLFPGCIVLKNDAHYIQGIPDLTLFYGGRYFVLECKRDTGSNKLFNQRVYIKQINDMGGYARFIYPENEKEILDEIANISRSSRT